VTRKMEYGCGRTESLLTDQCFEALPCFTVSSEKNEIIVSHSVQSCTTLVWPISHSHHLKTFIILSG